jgi:hypothetical protein
VSALSHLSLKANAAVLSLEKVRRLRLSVARANLEVISISNGTEAGVAQH